MYFHYQCVITVLSAEVAKFKSTVDIGDKTPVNKTHRLIAPVFSKHFIK